MKEFTTNIKKIFITVSERKMPATLNNSETAHKIFEALPLTAAISLWGEEIYFKIPIKMNLEQGFAQDTVHVGDLGYWPEGACFCMFFGLTPLSEGKTIRPASSVNIIGNFEVDKKFFKTIKVNEQVQITQE